MISSLHRTRDCGKEYKKKMRTKQLESIIEAILFTMGDSVEVSKIASAIEKDVPTTEKLIHNMMDKYQKEERGIRIIELDHAYQLCSKPEMYEYLIRIAKQPKKYVLTDRHAGDTFNHCLPSADHQAGD